MHLHGKDTVKVALMVLLAAAAGTNCSNSGGTGGATSTSGTGTASTTTTTTTTTSTTKSATTGATSGATTGATSSSTGMMCAGSLLTVKNFDGWCNVAVGNGAAVSTDQTVCVQNGMVTMTATANTGFILSNTMWHHTTDDTGNGGKGMVTGATSTDTVNVTGAACVWVCCPFPDGTGCPAADQCAAGG